ncbi:MAG: YcaO-like family protein [Rhodospirillaceae bacterium]|nr:YcaO-like family protein [Rhodospirillaceae bacterium]
MLDDAASTGRIPLCLEPPPLPCERDLPVYAALARIQEAIFGFGLKYDLQLLGVRHRTVVAKLLGADGTVVSQGVGKGDLAQAIVGALFEAVEHHCTMGLVDHPNSAVVPIADLLNAGHCADERIIDLLRGETGTRLAVRRYAPLVGQEQITYPLFLTDPAYWRQDRLPGDDFGYARLLRYSSNSGTAIGSNGAEALTHALNEVIERDAFSEFLVSQFYAPTGEPVRLVSEESLPSAIETTLSQARRELGAEIYLIDMTSRFGVPTYLAAASASTGGIPSHGCGTSLDAGHAIQRSVTELIQYHHVRTYLPAAASDVLAWAGQLEAYPALRRCLEMDIGARIKAVGRVHVPVGGADAQFWSGRCATDHKFEIARRIELAGSRAYFAIRHMTENGITVATALIPGCDRFFLVASGLIVLPSRRLLMAPEIGQAAK